MAKRSKRKDMTPNERVMAAAELREVDHVPCLPFIREYGITYFGYTFSQMYEDYRRFVDVNVNFQKEYDLDCVWDIMMTSPEAEAMGLKQVYQAPNPVQSPLENSTEGYEVIDFGVDVPNEVFVSKANEMRPHVLGMSAVITTTMPRMQDVISMLSENGIRNEIKVIVGGAPVTQKYADKIGADAYGDNGTDAIRKIAVLLNH